MKYKFVACKIALIIFALSISLALSLSVGNKQEPTISDFINNFAGTPGSENFMEKSLSITQKKGPKSKPKVKKLKREILNPKKIYMKGWLKVSSHVFENTRLFPTLNHPQGEYIIKTDKHYFRINEDYNKSNKNGSPGRKYFWFRLSGRHLYYSPNPQQINVLDNIYFRHVKYAFPEKDFSKNALCFQIADIQNRKYTMCAKTLIERNKWICLIQKALGHPQDPICRNKLDGKASATPADFVLHTVIQPMFIIPTPTPHCNENWNYIGSGTTWECECKEGKEQSPINLPTTDKAIFSAVKPIFHYEPFSPISPSTFKDGLVREGENIKIRYIQHALRIYHPNMGRILTIDGTSYTAEEIVFHTPSEHTINGKRYDMEMQVVHRGTTQGDIAKNAILSVLFQKKAGYYNKFLDKIDPFNLPNPHESYREITEELYIPHVFRNVNEEDIPIMKPFSFYTYQGSLTQPPCSERTIVYVASKPLFLSSTTLEMFKEALRMPDLIGENGEIQITNQLPFNFRNIQKLNGRAVFHYDSDKLCGTALLDDFKTKKVKPRGHYEKKISKATEYFFVNGERPSGLPGALVVSEKEAKGIQTKK